MRFDMKTHFITHKNRQYKYWYDRSYRCWFAVQILDEEGNESATVDSYFKEEIIKLIKFGYVGGGV